MALYDSEKVVCYTKLLRTEVYTKITYKEKLASWNKAREIGVCPPFLKLEKYHYDSFENKKEKKRSQYSIVVEAGETLQNVLAENKLSVV